MSSSQGRARVRAWARDIWRLGEADAVVVVELPRTEPRLGLETVIVIATGDGTTVEHTLPVPAVEIRREDLRSLAAGEIA